jgi:hypothetical protein
VRGSHVGGRSRTVARQLPPQVAKQPVPKMPEPRPIAHAQVPTPTAYRPKSIQAKYCANRIKEILAANALEQKKLRCTEKGASLEQKLRTNNYNTAVEVAHRVEYNGGTWTWEVMEIMLLLVSCMLLKPLSKISILNQFL